MEYAQLNEDGSYSHQITTHGNVEWDANNFCTAEALVKDGKAEQFRVVPLHETEPPVVDPAAKNVFRDGGELVNGRWQYKWAIRNKTPDEITAYKKSLVPQQVTMRQARLALLQVGKLSQVAGIIESMPSPQKEAAQIEWEYSQTVERHRPLVQTLGPALGLTEAQIDQLFITAATL